MVLIRISLIPTFLSCSHFILWQEIMTSIPYNNAHKMQRNSGTAHSFARTHNTAHRRPVFYFAIVDCSIMYYMYIDGCEQVMGVHLLTTACPSHS